MNVSDVFDWTFFWQMFRNFVATGSPFVMVMVAVSVAGAILTLIVSMMFRKKS